MDDYLLLMASDDSSSKKVKIGLEIPAVLDKQINDIVEKMGYTDRAEFIRAAIREKIESWKKEHPSHGVNDLK